jgi:cell division septation protein DedD
MASQNKSALIMLVLVVAGAVIFVLSSKPNNGPTHKVVMQEVFEQKTEAVPASVPVEKDPVPSPAIVTSPEHGKEAGFAVQVYSFKDKNRADVALTNLREKGYATSFIEMSDLGERGTWYRVRIGGLENEAQAKALLETIRKSFNSGIIIKPKP